MPMEYLKALEPASLPRNEADMDNIDKLRILRAAGMVEAQLPPVDAPQQNARVLYITGLGCAPLRAHGTGPRRLRADIYVILDTPFD